jgi:hypothetical protein
MSGWKVKSKSKGKSQKAKVIREQMMRPGKSFDCLDAGVGGDRQLPLLVAEALSGGVCRTAIAARQYNLDPKRVAAAGGSAGAVNALWIAFHDEMADPKSDDPVKRQSTRLSAAGCGTGRLRSILGLSRS